MTALRVYAPEECGLDGYPLAWHSIDGGPGVKHLVRAAAGDRCVRCRHPYQVGRSSPEWSPCDEHCTHGGPFRAWSEYGDPIPLEHEHATALELLRCGEASRVEAAWRVLTVHHLRLGTDAKRDLRWWNLAALCQRCHLAIQGKVQMQRVWPWAHSEWFKPYAAGWYAWSYLGEDLTREETEARLDELLALELVGGGA